MPIVQGGPALDVVVASGVQHEGGAAIPVAVVTDGRASSGGNAQRVIVVTNPAHIAGGPAIPVVLAPAGARVEGGPAMRVYVVQGSLSPAPAFSPSQITGLQAWYKADAIVGLNNNDPVSSWLDSIGVAGAATQGVGANQPTYKTAIQNGLPVVRGNGTSTQLSTAAFTHGIGTGDMFYAAVVKTPASLVAGPAICDLGTDTPLVYFSGASKPDLYLVGDHVFTTARLGSTWYTFIFRRLSGVFDCWVNGVQDASTFALATTVNNTSVLRLGAEGGAAARWWGGDTGEFLFGKTLSNVDRVSLESYLRTKWAHY